MSSNSSRVRLFIEKTKTALSRQSIVGTAAAAELKNVVSLLGTPFPITGKFGKSKHPILLHVKDALSGGNTLTGPLLKSLSSLVQYLPWRYSYPPRPDAPELGERIAFAEIIGPEAPLYSESVCFGLTLIAPHTLYPEHRHPAIELYYVLAGTASWRLNGVARDFAPGSSILHPSQAVHAMQTNGEALLAIYTWSGADIRTSSVYTDSIKNQLTQYLYA